MSLTLGVHIGHDGGVALVEDGEILVACSEERLTRFKYANGWWSSLRYCLDEAGRKLSDVDLIVFSNAGEPLPSGFDGGLSSWATKPLRTCTVDHHLSHAVGAFAFSGYEGALVFVADAGGNLGVTESAYVFDRRQFVEVMKSPRNRPRCRGLGTTYEAFTNFLGFTDQESGKTMALAAFGDGTSLAGDLFLVGKNGEISSDLEMPHQWGIVDWGRRRGQKIGPEFPESHSTIAKDVAAFIQHAFEKALAESLSRLLAVSKQSAVAISGGVALNCVANTKLRSTLKGDLSFFPVCSDAGLPLGNALYGQFITDGQIPCLPQTPLLLGRHYPEPELLRALLRHPDTVPPGDLRLGDLEYTRSNSVARDTAQMIADGLTVAWLQGRSELGPRALGARYILANPRVRGIRDKINDSIKEREWFRPFGPSILAGDIGSYIRECRPYPYMIEAPAVTELGAVALGDCVHVDQSARVQTVDQVAQPLFGELLNQLSLLTGHGVLLNTSFNVQGPIVETPGDAIATFLRSRIDVLILGEFICTRK